MLQLTAPALVFMLAICVVSSCAALAAGAPTTRPVVVVELFTSEGCSSCPPADAVLADLAKPEAVDGVQIIPLAMHVDYWNRLGWVDPFSSAQFSARQQQYARVFNSDQIYTPQMIVDGTEQFVGSDKPRAIAAITRSATHAKGLINIDLEPDPINANSITGKISINDIHGIGSTSADVLLAVTEDDLSSDVPRGENAGRILSHTAVVRSLVRLASIGPTDPTSFSTSTAIALQPAWRPDHLLVAVFVQDPAAGKILAAGCQRILSSNYKNLKK